MTGILPVDKPEGPTSHDAVAAARRALGVRRIGHTGTLDPFATGLLLLCVGPATRLAEYFGDLDKAYTATARLGVETDTLDRTGTTTATSDAWRELDDDAIRRAFEEQVGRRLQTPPAYSAKKIAGRRAYEMARAGQEVAPPAVEVVIHVLRVLDVDADTGLVRFEMTCAAGTYVRAVARDAGEALGVGAHLTELRRTRIGRFAADEALPLDRIDDPDAVAAALVPPLKALGHLPVVELTAEEAAAIRHGRPVAAVGRAAGGMVALAADGALLAMAESDGERLRPRKVMG
jgi:tRNA pseudouridine55 synthase